MSNKKNKKKKVQRYTLLPRVAQQYYFGLTSIIWISQLNPNIFPQLSQFIATKLRLLYKYLPYKEYKGISFNALSNGTLFGTKRRGAITICAAMSLLTAYWKSNTVRSIINKVFINPFSIRLYELCGYLMPLYSMTNALHSKTNSFAQFMAWSSLIWVTNGMSTSIGKPIYKFLRIRDIQYFGLISYTLGLLSPNIDISINKKSDLIYTIIAFFHLSAFVGYLLGFDNGK